jgi:hypothetical protein
MSAILGILCKLHNRAQRYPHLSPKRFYMLTDPLVQDVFAIEERDYPHSA